MGELTKRVLLAFLIVFEIAYAAGLITGYVIITTEYGSGNFNIKEKSWYEHKRGKDIINGLIAFAVFSLIGVVFNIIVMCIHGISNSDNPVLANYLFIALMSIIYVITMWPIEISNDFPYNFIIGAYGVNAFIALIAVITFTIIVIKRDT